MQTLLRRPWAATLLLAGILMPMLAQASVRTPAITAATVQQPQSTGASQDTFVDNKTANSQNLAKAEKEDEEYTFKHSASVRAFARWFHLSPEMASMAFWALNALILFAFVGYFVVTGLPKAFRSRRQQLEREMVQARTATEQANERLRVVEERMSRLDSEIAAVRAQTEQDSAQDEQRIHAAMEQERQKIVAAAESEIASAGKAAERRLRSFAAELAVTRATGRLRLTEEDDRALVQEFAADLGAAATKEGRN